MRPLADLIWIGLDATIDEVLTEVRSSRYTRYPVRDPETLRFVGLLHIKDLLTASERLRDIRNLQPYLRKLPHVDEHQRLESALAAFRRGDPHFAIVTGTLGTEIGFLTFENAVEALFGPVEDEFSKTSPAWQRAEDGSVTGAGSLSLLSLEEALGVSTPEVDANSVGGLVTETLGRIPVAGERIAFPEFEIEVLSTDGPRIDMVRVSALDSVGHGDI
jgi:CBS domain containing-hemolysin-like protein